jgi:Ni/Fe-hydrogenase subunit HybB-like protein
MGRLESEIAEYVGNYARRRGYPPTMEELISTFGMISILGAMFYVLNLYRIGMIRNSLILIPVKNR